MAEQNNNINNSTSTHLPWEQPNYSAPWDQSRYNLTENQQLIQEWAEVSAIVQLFENEFDNELGSFQPAPWYRRMFGYKWLYFDFDTKKWRTASPFQEEQADGLMQDLAKYKKVQQNLFSKVNEEIDIVQLIRHREFANCCKQQEENRELMKEIYFGRNAKNG